MPFADECVPWETLFAHDIRPYGSVADVRLCSETANGRRIALEDTNIVHHGGLFHENGVGIQFRMPLYDFECHIRHSPAMSVEDVVELGVCRVITGDDAIVVHNRRVMMSYLKEGLKRLTVLP